MTRYIIVTSLLLATACKPPPVCTPGHTACEGNFVLMCDANGQFQPRMDCAAVSERTGRFYSCQLVDSPPDEDIQWDGASGYACEIERDAIAQ